MTLKTDVSDAFTIYVDWPVPKAPTEDARVKEALRLLQKLPEDRRDAALEGLKKLRDGK